MPPNRCLIYSKWVFKKKRDGRFRESLVALGYPQIPRVDLTENYSPVANDITLCLILIMWLIKKWDSQTIDVETLLLYAVIEEDIHVNILEVRAEVLQENYTYEYILMLIKYIYGLVQASNLCFKGYINTMILNVGFKQCRIYPCLLYRLNELGTVIFIVYVNYTLEIGNKPAFMDTIECIKK